MEDYLTYYEILEITESATEEEIQTAYRHLSHEYHPDKVPSHLSKLQKDAEEKFKQISEAYQVLHNPDKRKKYDVLLKELREKKRDTSPDIHANDFTKAPASPATGTPKLAISKTSFEFTNVRKGFSISDNFTISNIGGGFLSGTIKTNKNWLKVHKVNIDNTRHKQDISFYIDISGLPFGFKDTGEIEIKSNGGYEGVSINISVEMPEEDLSRFRSGLTIGGLIVGGLFGYLLYNVNFIQGMNVNVAGIAGIVALIGAIVAAGWLGYQDEGAGAAFGWGCGTLVVGGIILAILKSYFPHALSTFSWTLAYGSFGNLLSTPIRKAIWKGDMKTPITVGAVALALTGGIIIVGFVSAKEERQTELAKIKAIQSAIQVTRTKLPGEWHGNVGNRMAKLFISQESGQLSGKMMYHGVEEELLVDVKNKDSQIFIVLKGTGYKRLKGKGGFNLDTFYASLFGGNILKGNFIDTARKKGTWSVSKPRPPSVNVSGIWEGRWKIEGSLVNPLFPSEMSFTVSIQQSGSLLNGSLNYHGKKGTSNIKGQVRHLYGKNQVSFEYNYSDGTVMSYQGALNNRGDKANGKWSGKRYSGSWKMNKIRQLKEMSSQTGASETRPCRLSVETMPTEARIRILNIQPKFYQGMKLEPGRYHVEVSAKGYKTKRMWIELGAEDDSRINVSLIKIRDVDTLTKWELRERKALLEEQEMGEKRAASATKYKKIPEKKERPAADKSVPSLPPPPTY